MVAVDLKLEQGNALSSEVPSPPPPQQSAGPIVIMQQMAQTPPALRSSRKRAAADAIASAVIKERELFTPLQSSQQQPTPAVSHDCGQQQQMSHEMANAEKRMDEKKRECATADGAAVCVSNNVTDLAPACQTTLLPNDEQQQQMNKPAARLSSVNNAKLNNGNNNNVVGMVEQSMIASAVSGAGMFSLSWRVEWSGTFPVGKVSVESVTKRMDALLGFGNATATANMPQQQPKRRLAGTRALLTISGNGVQTTAVDNAELLFLSHPIRKVCCVLGRVETQQLAYVTREQPSHTGRDIPYRKQCHVFRTETAFEVEEIESVLSAAFHRVLAQDGTSASQMMNSPSPKLRMASASVRDMATSPLFDFAQPSPRKTPKKDKVGAFFERSRSQMRISSTSLIQKIFGTTPKKQQQQQQQRSSPKPLQQQQNGGGSNTPNGNGGVRFRKPRWPLTPLRSCTSSTACSATPKRPYPPTISAPTNAIRKTPTNNNTFLPAFPIVAASLAQQQQPLNGGGNIYQAYHQSDTILLVDAHQQQRKSSQPHTNNGIGQCCINNGYGTAHFPAVNAVGGGCGCQCQAAAAAAAVLNPYHQQPRNRDSKNSGDVGGCGMEPSAVELVYDERLKEWIYPLDESQLGALERLAYFCRPNERELVMEQLRRMPIGHFVLRLSGSRRRCLALTVRVEETTINPKGIAHYLLIRNEHGFRIRGSKRYFQSLPMLITHHSVLAEQFPCRLQLSDWRWTREPQNTRRRQSSGGSTLAALRARDERDETTDTIRWRHPPHQHFAGNGIGGQRIAAAVDYHQPRKTATSSTMFSSKSSTVLSA